jgi:hypothetical protein
MLLNNDSLVKLKTDSPIDILNQVTNNLDVPPFQ